MKVLVANLGSTSFKYRLYDLPDASGGGHGGGVENLLARGAVERIGSANARITTKLPTGDVVVDRPVLDHGDAVESCLAALTDPATGVLKDAAEVAAIGFKAVHAQGVSGVQRVTPEVLAAMEAFRDVAPAHNPPYIHAMRLLGGRFPSLPLVAAFETGFHQTIPDRNAHYAVPHEWATEHGIRRWGFHGASHRFIAGRMAELLGRDDLKLITCHLGGSSSLCASIGGRSVATTMGMSPQSGLPQNNRVGDFDVFALPAVMRLTNQTLEQVLDTLANASGLQGLGGAGNDLRDIEAAAERGDRQANLALDVYVGAVRHYLGAYLVDLGGADAIAFTGGIGENSTLIRERVCHDLAWFGITLDPTRNSSGEAERAVSADHSRVALWTVPTNEEIVVARQTRDLLAAGA